MGASIVIDRVGGDVVGRLLRDNQNFAVRVKRDLGWGGGRAAEWSDRIGQRGELAVTRKCEPADIAGATGVEYI